MADSGVAPGARFQGTAHLFEGVQWENIITLFKNKEKNFLSK